MRSPLLVAFWLPLLILLVGLAHKCAAVPQTGTMTAREEHPSLGAVAQQLASNNDGDDEARPLQSHLRMPKNHPSRSLQVNNNSSTTNNNNTMGTCGFGFRGNGICPDGACCDLFGWCGTDCSVNNSSFSLQPGEWCKEDFQCISGSCCFFDRSPDGPLFQCSSIPCKNDDRHDGDRDGGRGKDSDRSDFDTRDQAEFAQQDQSSSPAAVYYFAVIGVILMLLLLVIIYLLIRKKGVSCCAKAKPVTDKRPIPGNESGMVQPRRQPNANGELQSTAREPTLPNTITISSNPGKREPTRPGQLVYPVMDPSISDQSSSYTTPSFPGTTTDRSKVPSSRRPRSIMSEPTSSIDGDSNH